MKSHVEQISAAILTLNQPRAQSDEPEKRHDPDRRQHREQERQATMDQRLVIEEDPAKGTFIYTTIDRTTGEILSRMPREELLRLRESPVYSAGSVIAAQA